MYMDPEGSPRTPAQLARDVLEEHWRDDRGDCGGCDHQSEWPCNAGMLAQHVLDMIDATDDASPTP